MTPIELFCFTGKLKKTEFAAETLVVVDSLPARLPRSESYRNKWGTFPELWSPFEGPSPGLPVKLRHATTHSRASKTYYNSAALQTAQAARWATGAHYHGQGPPHHCRSPNRSLLFPQTDYKIYGSRCSVLRYFE